MEMRVGVCERVESPGIGKVIVESRCSEIIDNRPLWRQETMLFDESVLHGCRVVIEPGKVRPVQELALCHVGDVVIPADVVCSKCRVEDGYEGGKYLAVFRDRNIHLGSGPDWIPLCGPPILPVEHGWQFGRVLGCEDTGSTCVDC